MNIALLKLKSSQNEFARNLCCTTNVKEFLSQFEFPVHVYYTVLTVKGNDFSIAIAMLCEVNIFELHLLLFT